MSHPWLGHKNITASVYSPSLVSHLLILMGACCHVVSCSVERPTWQGRREASANSQQELGFPPNSARGSEPRQSCKWALKWIVPQLSCPIRPQPKQTTSLWPEGPLSQKPSSAAPGFLTHRNWDIKCFLLEAAKFGDKLNGEIDN